MFVCVMLWLCMIVCCMRSCVHVFAFDVIVVYDRVLYVMVCVGPCV